MGRVKEFAAYLSEQIYQREMNDREVIAAVKYVGDDSNRDDYDPWLQEQIEVVRKNPQVYKTLVR